MIRNVSKQDAQDIVEIYNNYISNSTITFETEPLHANVMEKRISDISENYPFFVYELNGKVIGYCYVHQWKERAAYTGVVELSIYLSSECVGKGIGTELMRYMIDECRNRKYRVIITCVTGENNTSKALQSKLGFTQVAHFKDIGLKFNRLIDIFYYQLTL